MTDVYDKCVFIIHLTIIGSFQPKYSLF